MTTESPLARPFKPSIKFHALAATLIPTIVKMYGIKGICKKAEEIRPMVAITKLDECWVGAEEFSALALNNARIGIVTGTKVIIDSLIQANEDSLTKYMKENFVDV